MATKPKTLGQLIDDLAKADEAVKAVAAKEKLVKADYAAAEEAVFAALDAQQTRVGESKTKRVSISVSEEPKTEDWEEFLAWAAKTKNLHMIQHRISAPAWREIKALKTKGLIKTKALVNGQEVDVFNVPGISTFLKRKLSVTSVSSK